MRLSITDTSVHAAMEEVMSMFLVLLQFHGRLPRILIVVGGTLSQSQQAGWPQLILFRKNTMSRITDINWVIARVLLLVTISLSAELYSQVDGQVVVTYSLDSPNLSLSQPLVLVFNVENNSSEPIRLELGQDLKANYIFIMTWPSGTTVQLPQWSKEGISGIGTILVPAGNRFTTRFVLNEWTDFTDLGKYTLEVRLTTPIQSENGVTIQEVPPYRTSFEILPRDEMVLTKICEKLTETIEASQSVQVDMDAALILSYISDPIAIPYMKRALNSGSYVENQIMDGLARIGDWDAVLLLVSIIEVVSKSEIANINSVVGNRAILAGQALYKIDQQTSDLGMKQLIKQTLQKFN